MENYKIRKDNDDKNIELKLNKLYKDYMEKTNKSIELSRLNKDYDKEIYNESVVGQKKSQLKNNSNRISHMIGNKGVAFSVIVD